MTKMRTTIEHAKECGIKVGNILVHVELSQLEAFRLSVEADFVSRCTFEGYKNSDNTKIYTLPKETK